MPKPKKAAKADNKTTKAAGKEQVLDEPSLVGSSVGHNDNEKETHEANGGEVRRYASITGDTTPPRQVEAGEKV